MAICWPVRVILIDCWYWYLGVSEIWMSVLMLLCLPWQTPKAAEVCFMYCSFKSYLYDIGDAKRAKRYIAKILQTFFQSWAFLGVGWVGLHCVRMFTDQDFIYFWYFCLDIFLFIYFFQTHLFKSKQQCTKLTFSLL